MTDTLSGLYRVLTYYDTSYPPDILDGGGPGEPPDPVISSLTPDTAEAGSGTLSVAVRGSNYASDAVVEVDGSALVTTVVSNNHLTVDFTVPDASGEVIFTVRNVTTTKESNDFPFDVTEPAEQNPEIPETPPDETPPDETEPEPEPES